MNRIIPSMNSLRSSELCSTAADHNLCTTQLTIQQHAYHFVTPHRPCIDRSNRETLFQCLPRCSARCRGVLHCTDDSDSSRRPSSWTHWRSSVSVKAILSHEKLERDLLRLRPKTRPELLSLIFGEFDDLAPNQSSKYHLSKLITPKLL